MIQYDVKCPLGGGGCGCEDGRQRTSTLFLFFIFLFANDEGDATRDWGYMIWMG